MMTPMADDEFDLVSGRLPTDLGKAVSVAIHHALSRGMEVDAAVCVAIRVACDYARHAYGDDYITEGIGKQLLPKLLTQPPGELI